MTPLTRREAGDASTRMAEPIIMASTTHYLPEPDAGFGLLAGAALLRALRRRRGA